MREILQYSGHTCLVVQRGGPGDVWLQGVAYSSSGTGSTGAGPDTINLLFEVTGISPIDGFVPFDLGLTTGDTIVGATNTTFSSALVTPMPEPNTVLLIGLGLAALAATRQGREKSGFRFG